MFRRPRSGRAILISLGTACIGAIAAVIGVSGCSIATGFRGPGYDRKAGVTLQDVGPSVIVVMTHAVYDPAQKRTFFDATNRVADSLPDNPGLVGHSIRTRIFGHEAWTMTIWRDHESADEFAVSPIHKEAVRVGMPTLRSSRFLRFDWPTNEVPPPWSDAIRRLEAQGRDPGAYAPRG
jgi:heme-degrading monooxygenase HmoA